MDKSIEQRAEEKTLDYWRGNAEEDYGTTPISVLRYISLLEQNLEVSERLYTKGEMEKFAIWASQPENYARPERQVKKFIESLPKANS